MAAPLAHFAINADDVDAARRFYERVFGWRFEPWGPSGFFHIDTGDDARRPIFSALQQRRDLLPGTRTVGLECTFAVTDVDAIAREVVAAGGRIVAEKFTIPGVGDLIWIEDPSGNVIGAMRYDEPA
jgi:predicted enzyme related to lactoylglutathione lyase